MRTIILTAILSALATPACALSITTDLKTETTVFSIPAATTKQKAWLATNCPGNRWVLTPDRTEIQCVTVKVTGTGTTRSVTP